MKTLVRTNVILPKELVEAIDRYTDNRSRFLAEAAAKRLADEQAREIIRKSAGALKGSPKRMKAVIAEIRAAEIKKMKALSF